MKSANILAAFAMLCWAGIAGAEGPAPAAAVTPPSVSMPVALVPAGPNSLSGQPAGALQAPATLAVPAASLSLPVAGEAVTLSKEEPSKAGAASDKARVNSQMAVEAVEPSAIEKALAEDSQAAEKSQPQVFSVGKISQFGYDFFRPEAAGFAPLIDIPVGPDYVLGAGDRVVLTLWGSVEGTYELEINRAGELVLPRVGAVKVSGQTYGQLPALLKAHLGRVFKDFQININMGKLRLIKVYVVGQVRNPGDYNVSSLATVINALAVAGGPKKNGTLRAIKIKRNGKLVETVDLYDFFLRGDKSKDIRLQPGDTIFVPTIGPLAGVAGNVRTPAIFELKNEKTLKDLLALANGIQTSGYLQRVQISRIEANDKKIVSDVNLDSRSTGQSLDELAAAIRIQDMDMVKIFPIDTTLRGYARLEGYVLRPGDYALKPGLRIRELLGQDNLLPEYFTEAGQILRLVPPDLHPEVIYFNVGKAMAGDTDQNMPLQEFDRVRIFSRWEMEETPSVRISGDVQKPGQYRQYSNMTVRDLLMQAGNPRQTAYLKSAEITRIKKNGEAVTSYSININLAEAIKGNPQHNIALAPFDELVVRKIPNWSEETDRTITLKGEFVFPGVYPIYRGEKLSSVIRRAGGFSDKAFLRGASFYRQQVRELQQKRMDEILAKTEVDLIKKQGELASTAASKEELEATKTALSSMMKSLEVLKKSRAEGRMVLRITSLGELENSEADIEVMGGDILFVPTDPKVVTILGQVYNSNSFVHMQGEQVRDCLAKAGGPTRDAEEGDMFIVKADGSIVSRQMSSSFLGFGGFMSTSLESGDTIVVPQRLEKTAWMRDLKDIAFIFGQLALTAGVMVAAGL